MLIALGSSMSTLPIPTCAQNLVGGVSGLGNGSRQRAAKRDVTWESLTRGHRPARSRTTSATLRLF